MRFAIFIVSFLAVALIGILFYQYDQLAFQIAQSPSFRIGNPEEMPVQPTKKSAIKSDSLSFSLFEFYSDSLSKPLILVPGIGFYMSDWFAYSKQLADLGYHVYTFPLEFSESNQLNYSWGKRDRKNLEFVIDSVIKSENFTLIAFDFGAISLDHFRSFKNAEIILVNPKYMRSDYVGMLVDLSFGFSIDSKNKSVWKDISRINTLNDTIDFDFQKITHAYFNPNIAISSVFLTVPHTNLNSNWEYGKFNFDDLKSIDLKKWRN